MISVLFCQPKSIYKTIPGLDCWDEARDAMQWPGGNPAIFHPPCRGWSSYRHMAKPPIGEKEMALWAVCAVREWGGVLEHPAYSTLWRAIDLPLPGNGSDRWGGETIVVCQRWWGHSCIKPTWLYVVPKSSAFTLPIMPFNLSYDGRMRIKSKHGKTRLRNEFDYSLPRSQRSATPLSFAEWLIDLAEQVA